MSDSETATTAPPPEHDTSSAEPKKETSSGISLTIWPPSQRTRDAVIARLIETLSSTSILSKRYGTMPQDEASETASRIEGEAFTVATAAFSPEEDGLEVLQLYSKEISKRMLETVKARAGTGATVDNSAKTASDEVAPAAAASEEVSSSVEAEA